MSGLPRGWVEATIRDLCELINGKAFKPSDWTTEGLPIVRIQNLNNPNSTFNYYQGLVEEKFLIEDGQLLFAWSGTPGTSFGAHVWNGGRAVLNQHIFKVNFPFDLINKHFLRNAINQKLEELIGKAHGGAGLQHVTKGKFEETLISLPPLAEQKRIVAKLDALNAKSARARIELARIETLVSRYKQAVLSKAFSGELTREWRLTAIQNDIEAALNSVRAKRQSSPKLARRKAVSDVPQAVLPDTWRWISPDELAADAPYAIGIGPFGSNLVKADYRAQGVRLVFVRDIRREEFSAENAVYVDHAKADELHQHWVTGGDVLITKMGDPPGDTAIYPQEQPSAVITADCIKLRPHLDLTSSKFLYWAIRSQTVRSQILDETKGVAQQKLSLDRFRQIAIPTPPLEEQNEIVHRIESAFARIDRLAKEAKRALELVGRLDEAILAKAFRGELVPQDENDEPAEHLLARIRAERAASPKGKRGRGRRHDGL